MTLKHSFNENLFIKYNDIEDVKNQRTKVVNILQELHGKITGYGFFFWTEKKVQKSDKFVNWELYIKLKT